MRKLFAVVHTDDDDGVGDPPTIVALFIEYLQSALDHVDVAAGRAGNVAPRRVGVHF
jgi:hypothetical protein